jgi:hypothetical protein
MKIGKRLTVRDLKEDINVVLFPPQFHHDGKSPVPVFSVMMVDRKGHPTVAPEGQVSFAYCVPPDARTFWLGYQIRGDQLVDQRGTLIRVHEAETE